VSHRAAFVDRDGTIDELVPDPASGLPESPLRAQDVRLIPGAAAALRRLAGAGWLLVGVSNQPAAAKGTVTLAQLAAVQERVVELLAAEGVVFDAFRVCLHHPDGIVPELTERCECRKPRPGMLLDAASELGVDLAASWMLGDTDTDVLAGRAAGCRAILIEHAGTAHKRAGGVRVNAALPSLERAVEWILAHERVR
jgi:D-glycero-D-manno-heptose 1,7-bisphosphate phosphatase